MRRFTSSRVQQCASRVQVFLEPPRCAYCGPQCRKIQASRQGTDSSKRTGHQLTSLQEISVPSGKLFDSVYTDFPLANGLALECLPNRDSYPYAATYNLGSVTALESMFRGTLRYGLALPLPKDLAHTNLHSYRGFSRLMSSLNKLGVFDLSKPFVLSDGWPSFIPSVLQRTHELSTSANDASSTERAISSVIPGDQLQDIMEALSW